MATGAVSAMTAVLDEEIGELRAFVALLQQERALLVGAESDSLMPIVERKGDLTGRLQALYARREQLLTAAAVGSGRTGMASWLAASPADSGCGKRWQELLALAAEARHLNETNGELIRIHWQHNQAALAALTSAADRATTYGPDGQQRTSTGGRSLGNA